MGRSCFFTATRPSQETAGSKAAVVGRGPVRVRWPGRCGFLQNRSYLQTVPDSIPTCVPLRGVPFGRNLRQDIPLRTCLWIETGLPGAMPYRSSPSDRAFHRRRRCRDADFSCCRPDIGSRAAAGRTRARTRRTQRRVRTEAHHAYGSGAGRRLVHEDHRHSALR